VDDVVAAPMRMQTLTVQINETSTNRASATNCSQVCFEISARAFVFRLREYTIRAR
jgi:hypothetical protein